MRPDPMRPQTRPTPVDAEPEIIRPLWPRAVKIMMSVPIGRQNTVYVHGDDN